VDENIAPAQGAAAPEPQGSSAPDYESMSVEQLEQVVDSGAASPEKATPTQQSDQPQDQKADDIPAWAKSMQERLENIHRESGRWRQTQSQMDKKIQAEIRRALQEQYQQNQLNQLSPEERQTIEERQAQEQALQRLIDQRALEAVRQNFGEEFGFLAQAKENYRDQQFLGETARMADEYAPGSSVHIEALFKQNLADMESGDPQRVEAALRWNDRATKSPEFLTLELAKFASKQTQTRHNQFTQQREQLGQRAGSPKLNGTPAPSGRKPLNQMSQQELESMSVEELEKLVPEV
jgi:hypothetical protein